MSFGDPFGALWSGFGPESIRYTPDARPDVLIGVEGKIRRSRKRQLGDVLRFFGAFGAAAIVLTVVFVIPVLFSEVAMIETVGFRGQELTAAEYAERLKGLILGSFIVALSLVSFVAAAMTASPRVGVRDPGCNTLPEDRPGRGDPVLKTYLEVQNV